jgi:hypothetical protein
MNRRAAVTAIARFRVDHYAIDEPGHEAYSVLLHHEIYVLQ